MALPVLPISIVALVTIVASALTILGYLRYIPDVILMVRNPWRVLSVPKHVISVYRFKRFWRPIVGDGQVLVVFPAKDLDDHRDGTTRFDHEGLHHLLNDLNKYFRHLEVEPVSDEEFGRGHKDYNIISVAGPIPNRVSVELLTDPNVAFTFDRLQTKKFINSIVSPGEDVSLDPVTYYDESEAGPVCTKDYGILTRSTSPYNSDRLIVNAAGGYGEGTKAGCQLLRDPSVLATLTKKGGDRFQAVYGVPVSASGALKAPYILDEDSSEWPFDAPPVVKL